MGEQGVFEGSVPGDLIQWGGGGFLAGGVFGYGVAELAKKLGKPLSLEEVLTVTNRDAYRGAIFFGTVALSGHVLRAIF